MPETLEAPKQSFTEKMAAGLPKNAAEKAAGVAPQSATQAIPQAAVAAPEAVKPVVKESLTVPPAATHDPDEEILSGKRNPKGEDFKRVKHAAAEASKQRDELRSKAEAFEKELSEARKAPKHNAELIKQIEKERDEYKAKYDQVAVEWAPEFQAKYKGRVESILNTVKPMLPADRADKLTQLLQMPDSEWKRKAMAELTEDLDQFTMAKIVAADGRVGDVLAERQAELSKAGDVLTGIATERQKKAQERQEAVSKTFDAVLAKAQSKDGNPVFQLREGDAPEVKEWNAEVSERTRVAKAVFEARFESDSERAEAAMWAAAAPGFLKQLSASQGEIARLTEALAKATTATPGLAGGGGEQAKPGRGGLMEKMLKNTTI